MIKIGIMNTYPTAHVLQDREEKPKGIDWFVPMWWANMLPSSDHVWYKRAKCRAMDTITRLISSVMSASWK